LMQYRYRAERDAMVAPADAVRRLAG
jgi:hypothetical protein